MVMSFSPTLESSISQLSITAKRELALALLWSLPRRDIVAIHDRLAQLMQKDIIGLLPPEISLNILKLLNVDDLLNLRLVCKLWSQLIDEQAIWMHLCNNHNPPIRPAETSWNDLTVQRQLLQNPSSLSPGLELEDESFESGLEDFYTSDTAGQSLGIGSAMDHGAGGLGLGRMPAESIGNGIGSVRRGIGGIGGIGGGGTGRLRMVNQIRSVWERPVPGLPMYMRGGREASSGNDSMSRKPITQGRINDMILDPPIISHLPYPSTVPKVNYKHLYLVHRTLQRRMMSLPPLVPRTIRLKEFIKRQTPRALTLTSYSSVRAGGLPGHIEAVYSLSLFHHPMKVSMTSPNLGMDDDNDGLWFDPFAHMDLTGPTPSPSSWPGSSPSMTPGRTLNTDHHLVFTGRDWLLSGSRDRSLRLWQLACPEPRVVKVFSGGHSGSVLCHYVIRYPAKTEDIHEVYTSPNSLSSPKLTSANTGTRRASQGLSAGNGQGQRVIAVSGGSDGKICIWDVEHGDGTPEHEIEAHHDAVLFIRGDEDRIVSCSKDRTIRVFSMKTLEPLLVIGSGSGNSHRGAANALGITKQYIVSASGDRSVRVWDINTGALLATVDAHVRGISNVDFEPFPSAFSGWEPRIPGSILKGTIVTGSSDASIKIFHLVEIPEPRDVGLTFHDMIDLESDAMSEGLDESEEYGRGEDGQGREGGGNGVGADRVHGLGLGRSRLVIEPGHEHWASCTCPSPVPRPAGVKCPRCLDRGHTDLVRSLHLGERVVISGSYDSTVKVWDRKDGRLLANLEGMHSGRVFAVTGDRLRIVSSGLDSRIVLWDYATGLDTAFVEPQARS